MSPLPRHRRDLALASVPATVVLVLVAAVGAAGLWAFVDGMTRPEPAPSVGFVDRSDVCHPRLLVTSVSSPVDIQNVRILPIDDGAGYAILFAGHATIDEPWRGKPPENFLAGGSTVDLWAQSGRTFAFVDDGTGAMIAKVRAPAAPLDTLPPTASVEATELTAPALSIAGTATDEGCAGIGRVIVHFDDGSGGLFDAPAVLASAGGRTTAWSADLAAVPLVPGRSYAVTVTATDLAGNES